ncbi:MAG: SpoIIIAH-like family protein [Candidatus Pristimantibacillus lignocellulolyticus]|uniref:SpoIIIAH-like family protein n=1 Tax=Candidatus Pristimantibacillus lignocellulolyticus TaxID=2994561 RepID=A0A9J6ZDX1_9BACL|nr:MAG: SpoIIIAH-like family protein [Candidatus Pristimantibacillus lignocellulolyticus]
MNTKRQTIWLISMLSLMVVLSAYYLFTQDIGGKDKVTDATNLQNVAEVSTPEGKDATAVSGTNEDGSKYTISALDQEVLEQLKAENYFEGGMFSELLTKREQQYEVENNRINSVIADVSVDEETSIAAVAELEQLEGKMEKVTQLENDLMQTYEVVFVSEELNDKYKVVVTSDVLEKKQAAEIIDQVITVMDVRPEQVSVQFIPNP